MSMSHPSRFALATKLSGGGEEAGRTARAFATLLVVVLAVAPAGLILRKSTIEPVFDQSFIAYTFTEGYPELESGVTSHLIAGTLNLLFPYEPRVSNALMRGFVAILYMVAGGLLAWSLTGAARLWAFLLFVLLLLTSRFPFLWLSSEVFVGALLMLTLWSLVRHHRFPVTAALIVAFSFAKPELLLPGALLGLYLALRPDDVTRKVRLGILCGLVLALLLPGLLTEGVEYLQPGPRSLNSFGQHYASTVAAHQLADTPDPWRAWRAYIDHTFPGAESMGDVIRQRPDLYMDFVFLSMAQSIRRMAVTDLVWLFPLAVLSFRALKPQWKMTTMLLLTNLVPILLLSYLHARYQARFYPLALFVIVGALATPSSRLRDVLTASYLGGLLLVQTHEFIFFWNNASWALWFPD